jgi:hypothetical protein
MKSAPASLPTSVDVQPQLPLVPLCTPCYPTTPLLTAAPPTPKRPLAAPFIAPYLLFVTCLLRDTGKADAYEADPERFVVAGFRRAFFLTRSDRLVALTDRLPMLAALGFEIAVM